MFAQTKKCKYSINNQDEFTKRREARTNEEKLFSFNDGDFRNTAIEVKFTVTGDYEGGKKFLLFNLTYEFNTNNSEDYHTLSIMLENDSIINFVNPSNQGDKWNNRDHLYWKYFLISDELWNLLKRTNIKKVRLKLLNKSVLTQDINQKCINSISKVITCIDELNLPPIELNYNTDHSDTSLGSIISTNNNSSISLCKQWKRKNIIYGNGSVDKSNDVLYVQYYKDGTFLESITDKGTNTIKSQNKGKYELLNENTILLINGDSKDAFSLTVVKLTNQELILEKGGTKFFLYVY